MHNLNFYLCNNDHQILWLMHRRGLLCDHLADKDLFLRLWGRPIAIAERAVIDLRVMRIMRIIFLRIKMIIHFFDDLISILNVGIVNVGNVGNVGTAGTVGTVIAMNYCFGLMINEIDFLLILLTCFCGVFKIVRIYVYKLYIVIRLSLRFILIVI
jgi:hypothetical protein